jgi:hypothetical protein
MFIHLSNPSAFLPMATTFAEGNSSTSFCSASLPILSSPDVGVRFDCGSPVYEDASLYHSVIVANAALGAFLLYWLDRKDVRVWFRRSEPRPGYCSEFSFVTCCFSARLSIGKISPLHASTAAESALLVNQILLPHLHKLLQPVLPILRNPPRILPRHQRVIRTLIHQQLRHALDLEIRRVQLPQRRR